MTYRVSNSCYARILGVLIILLLTGPLMASAVTDHGLTWGVEEGDKIDYAFSLTRPGSGGGLPVNLDFYIIVNELTPIPDSVTDLPNITLDSRFSWNLTQYYSNGTLMDDSNFALVHGYAIDNWSLVQELKILALPWIIGYEEWEWIDNDAEWGFTYNATDPGGAITHKTDLYSKTDGLLTKSESERHRVDYSQIENYEIITRKGYDFANAYLPVAFVGIGVLIVIIAVIFIKKRS
jgi:hypothetical protein